MNFLLTSTFVSFVTANIVSLDFKLAERSLLNKYRFSFSDFDFDNEFEDKNNTLQAAMVKFNLEVKPAHTRPNVTYALFIVEADEEISSEIEDKILANMTEHTKL